MKISEESTLVNWHPLRLSEAYRKHGFHPKFQSNPLGFLGGDFSFKVQLGPWFWDIPLFQILDLVSCTGKTPCSKASQLAQLAKIWGCHALASQPNWAMPKRLGGSPVGCFGVIPGRRPGPKQETHLNQSQCFRCELLVSGRLLLITNHSGIGFVSWRPLHHLESSDELKMVSYKKSKLLRVGPST